MSAHGAPVRNTQRMPFKTARRLFHGLPRRSARRLGSGIKSSKISQCSSVISRVVAAGIDSPPLVIATGQEKRKGERQSRTILVGGKVPLGTRSACVSSAFWALKGHGSSLEVG